MHLFAQGLKQKLLESILYRQGGIPITINEWEDTARDEMKKHAYRQTMLNPGRTQFKWQFTKSNGNRNHRNKYVHPNDRTVPMDIDPPVFTQVNKAYTEHDKKSTAQKDVALIVVELDTCLMNALCANHRHSNLNNTINLNRRQVISPLHKSLINLESLNTLSLNPQS